MTAQVLSSANEGVIHNAARPGAVDTSTIQARTLQNGPQLLGKS